MKPANSVIITGDRVEAKILFIRGKKVIMDRDLAVLYGVETKVLNQAMKRNIRRSPADFMFQLSKEEMKIWGPKDGLLNTENWKSQIVTSNFNAMGLRKRPFVFTEQGIAMLSSVLKSERAITYSPATR